MSVENGRNVLVVYYSHDESTKSIAESIAGRNQCRSSRAKTGGKKSGGRKVKYIWEGESVNMDPVPDLEPFLLDPDNYDLIFIGSPVWAMSYAPPIESFIRKPNFPIKTSLYFVPMRA